MSRDIFTGGSRTVGGKVVSMHAFAPRARDLGGAAVVDTTMAASSAGNGLSDVEARLAAHQARHSAAAQQGASDRQQLPLPQFQWKFLTPLMWAPIFPAIRLSTKSMSPGKRNICIGIAIGLANLHGFFLINNPDLSDEALGIER